MEGAVFAERNKSKNRVCCGVRDCNSTANKNLNVVFHKFPKAGNCIVLLENFFGNSEKVDKFKAWKKLLKINKVTPQMRICSLHFKKTDYILPDYNSGRRVLKKIAVPSCNLPKSVGAKNTVQESRLKRRLERRKRIESTKKQNNQSDMEIDISQNQEDNDIIDNKNDISALHSDILPVTSSTGKKDIGIQVKTAFFTTTFMDLLSTESDFSTATGIQSYAIFNNIVGLVEVTYGQYLSSCKMTLRERIIMTYVKLKQNLSWTFLALIFKKCSAVQCRRIFETTLTILFKCLKVAIRWPSKEEISRNLPECFKDFEDVRVVIDCTEIFIQAPSKLCCQEITYSNYKSSTTCKIMTGVTPGGIISYFTKPYGGRHLDTAIFEQSDLIQLLEPGDAVMTDRGFLIEELCARNNWKLVRPPFMKNKKQLSKDEAILTSKNR